MRALVAGATGFIGRCLIDRLENPVVLTRGVDRARRIFPGLDAHEWNAAAGPAPAGAFEGVDAVFNLMGESLDGRWTPKKKEQIRDSRVVGTRNLVSTFAGMDSPPEVLVSVSAVGYYGSRGEEELDETAIAGDDFLAGVCSQWEMEAMRATEYGVRVVIPRLGLVLGRGGGAMKRIIPLFRWGFGGILGGGRQYWSWVHLEDVVGILLHSAGNRVLAGPLNAVAPESVTNRIFTKTLGGIVKRPAFFRIPSLALRFSLGEFSSLLLSSQRVVPGVLGKSGFRFRYPRLDQALESIA